MSGQRLFNRHVSREKVEHKGGFFSAKPITSSAQQPAADAKTQMVINNHHHSDKESRVFRRRRVFPRLPVDKMQHVKYTPYYLLPPASIRGAAGSENMPCRVSPPPRESLGLEKKR
jgi:hypothetical protein